jgi:hypothetical protein
MSAQSQHTPHPVTLVRAAVLWCRASGISVRLGSRGVICTSQHARTRWERDPDAHGVCPIGAALINYQPEATDPEEAAAECLFAPVAWVRVFEAALNHEDIPEEWAGASDRLLRAAAYEAGVRFREEFIRTRPAVVA